MEAEKILDVSWETIFKVAAVILLFYIIYLVREILVWTIFALIISVLLNPVVDSLQKKGIPRIVSVISIYSIIFGFIGLVIYFTAPLFLYEIQQFLHIFPHYFERFSPFLKSLGLEAFKNLETFTRALQQWLTQASSNIFSAMASLFGGISSTLSIIAIAITLSLEERGIERALSLVFPRRYQDYVLGLWTRCEEKVSGWFGMRLASSIFVGMFSYIAFFLFNIKYPFTLASLAGILEFVPGIGPAAAGIFIFFTALLSSFSKAIFAMVAFVLIQLIEGNILAPILTRKLIGIPPALVLISLMAGGELWGVLGAVLAIPLGGMVYEFLKEFLERKRETE